MIDLLDMDKLNAMGQMYGENLGSWWPIVDIDVQTGLCRIDVCGLLQCMHFYEFVRIKGDSGEEMQTDDFYVEDAPCPEMKLPA